MQRGCAVVYASVAAAGALVGDDDARWRWAPLKGALPLGWAAALLHAPYFAARPAAASARACAELASPRSADGRLA